ncbi:TrkH family potassium uptake protein [Streptomyces sp. CC228A]|uniref:TrkH family potassium uptake protein n=1 Tax=Streptomyces sp. CC228A TaxID=2898186 RepID=UPI001F3161AC|nr:potassium transporter TrkG [Streptomyces sp. CC228A]
MGKALFTRHPARTVVTGFALAVLGGAALLNLPLAVQDGADNRFVTALFTATSAVCVTGLTVVDTGTHWSGFGQGVILALIQVGGFGIMTMASLLALLVSGKLRLRMQLTAAAETKSLAIGDVRRVLLGVAGTTAAVELAVAAVLALRFRYGYGQPFQDAAYSGLFHAVSAFNNAGFGLRPDNLIPYATDPWVTLPVAAAVILGGIGFPVLLEVLRHHRRRQTTGRRGWSLHTKLTVLTTAVLLATGTVLTCLLEWGNPGTLGPMHWSGKLLNGFFHSAMSRTAGFNAVDIGAMEASTLLMTCTLMFIGGGSAGTAGGIKVTTFAVLAAAMLAEVRGEPNSMVMGRRIAPHALRQALTVALLGVAFVVAATLALETVVDAPLEAVLFEAVSAFATVGLSTGITADLPVSGELIVILLMFVGRLGPVTLVSALALRERTRRYELPEERPVIG